MQKSPTIIITTITNKQANEQERKRILISFYITTKAYKHIKQIILQKNNIHSCKFQLHKISSNLNLF